MFEYIFNNVKVALILKRKSKNETKSRVFWRITYKRKQVYYFTGKSYTESEWEEFQTTNKQKYREDKDDFQEYLDKTLKPLIRKLAVSNSFSFEDLNRELRGTGETTVNDAFENRIKMLHKYYKVGNANAYRTAFNALLKFAHYKKIRGSEEKEKFVTICIEDKHKIVGDETIKLDDVIQFSEITTKFLNECERFWRLIQLSDASISMYMRSFRALINNKPFIKDIEETGGNPYLTGDKYPFGEGTGKYIIPEGGRRQIALPIEDIWRIEDYETDNTGLIFARDIFMFMFYCNGLNFGDLCRLRFSDINTYTNEIKFVRKKTRSTKKGDPLPIYAPILPPMTEIINRHGNKDQKDYIFPFLNGIEPLDKNENRIKTVISDALVPINSSLKIIASDLELDPELSTSYTRNSYITHLTSELYISDILVKQMVGHSTRNDVTAGYNNPTPKKRREINSQLMNPNKEYAKVITLTTNVV